MLVSESFIRVAHTFCAVIVRVELDSVARDFTRKTCSPIRHQQFYLRTQLNLCAA